jgi:cytochrome P450
MTAEATPAADDLVSLIDLPMADDRTDGYRVLRDAGPLVRVDNGYLVATSESAEYVFKNPELFSSERAFDTLGSPVPLIPIAFDPPEHTRYRRLLQPFFTPRSAVLLMEPARSHLTKLIDGFVDEGSCDLVQDLAVPFPTEVFLTLFGLPLEDRDRLIVWKEAIMRFADLSGAAEPPPEVLTSALQLYEYLSANIPEWRGGTKDDVLSNLLSDSAAEPLSDDEVIGLCFLFVLAGLDTVTNVLSTMFAKLATQPKMRQKIVEDPSTIPDVVEEMLRIDPANPVIPRVLIRDVELHGRLIKAGTTVGVALGAANRDPAVYDDPDAIDLGRRPRHLTFGSGPHRCLGVHMARMELRLVLEEWHRRIPEYELAPGTRPQAVWPNSTVGIPSLPIVFPVHGGRR